MRHNTNPEHFLEVCVTLLWNFVPSFLRLSIPPFLNHSYFYMMRCRSRADVATSRRFYLLTSALLTQRRDAGTYRRGDVATLERRDVTATSLPCSPLLQKLLPTAALFAPMYLHPNQTPNRKSSHKNYKNYYKINVKMEDRCEYNMSVLGTHHATRCSPYPSPQRN